MSDRSSPVTLALQHIESGDLAGAQHCLESESDSEKVSGYYAELTKTLYTRNKDVRGMLALGRAGIRLSAAPGRTRGGRRRRTLGQAPNGGEDAGI
jgi:hypothetical protein